jgi:hypothetical protein
MLNCSFIEDYLQFSIFLVVYEVDLGKVAIL